MKRRTLLGIAAGAASLSGCSTGTLTGYTPADETAPPADDWTGAACPEPIEARRSVCPADGARPLDIERSARMVGGEAWTLRVTATNRADEPYGCDPRAWSVFRREGAGWVSVGPDTHVDPWVELGSGEAYTWLLSVTGRAATDAREPRGDLRGSSESPRDSGDADHRVFLALEPGRHAFVVPFDGPERLAAVAPFAVDE